MNSSTHTELNVVSRREALGRLLAGGAVVAGLPAGFAVGDDRIATATKNSGSSHSLAPGLRLATESHKALQNVKDYSASFYKQEMVGKTRVNHQLTLKIREQPFSAYLRYENPHKGREAIYVEGQNKNLMLAHGTGVETLVGTLELEPTSDRALEESRYPITMIGMRNMLSSLAGQWNSELSLSDQKIRYFPNAKVGNLECRVFESSYAQRQKGVKFHMTRLYVNKANMFPVRVEQFDFPSKTGAQPVILEQYTYLNVKPNLGLKDVDFDVENPAYDF